MLTLFIKPETQIDRDTWKRFKETGDPALRNEIILHYSYIVKYTVLRMRGMFRSVADQEDLINEGLVALMDAVERYSIDREVKFETYASIRVKGSIIDYVRKQDWVPRRVRKNAKDIDNAISAFWAEQNRQPSDEELATSLGISLEELQTNMAQSYNASIISFEELLADGLSGIESAMASLPATDAPEEALFAGELKQLLSGTIDTLPPKEKQVIAMYYFENLKLKEIAEVLSVSESRVCQMHTSALAKLKKAMESYIMD